MNSRISKFSFLAFSLPMIALTLSGSAFAGKKFHGTLYVTIEKPLVFKQGTDEKSPVVVHRNSSVKTKVGECSFTPKGYEYADVTIAPGTILPMEYDGWSGGDFLYTVKDPGYVMEPEGSQLVPTQRSGDFDGITMYCGTEKEIWAEIVSEAASLFDKEKKKIAEWQWLNNVYSTSSDKVLQFSITDPLAPAKK